MNLEQITHDQANRPGENDKIFFYPKEFYVFDNFSSFQVEYEGILYSTSEHAYQASKFRNTNYQVYCQVRDAKSAHDAQRIANENKEKRYSEWNEIKVEVMKDILRCKVEQHPYVLKKLLETGDREIIEDSWRDSQWGWGENKEGENLLGKIWMELREEYK